jgi:hypothetical protein
MLNPPLLRNVRRRRGVSGLNKSAKRISTYSSLFQPSPLHIYPLIDSYAHSLLPAQTILKKETHLPPE